MVMIKLKYMVLSFVLLCFFTPAVLIYLEPYSMVYPILKLGKCVFTIWFCFKMLYRNKCKIDLCFCFAFSFCLSLLFSSLIGELDIVAWFNMAVTMVGVFAFTDYYARKNLDYFIYNCFFYFLILLLINDILMILHPIRLFLISNALGNQSYHFLAQKNSFSMFSFPLLLMAHLCYERGLIKKYLLVLSVVIAALPNLISLSTTSVTTIIVFEVVHFLTSKIDRLRVSKNWLFILIIVCAMQLLFTYTFRTELIQNIVTNYMHKDPTLSGRAMIWDAAHEMISEHLILGRGNGKNGYYFYCVVDGYQQGSIMWSHNTSLDLLVQGGVLWFISFYMLVISSLKSIFKESLRLNSISVIMVLTFICYEIMGFTERFDFRVDLYFVLAIASIYKFFNIKNKV